MRKTQEQMFWEAHRKVADKNKMIMEMREEYANSGMSADEIWEEQERVNQRSRVFANLEQVKLYFKNNKGGFYDYKK